MIKLFSPKISAKKFAFLTQNKSKLYTILIITLVFEKNANFFAQNCQKSQKIVIITSTPVYNIKTHCRKLECGNGARSNGGMPDEIHRRKRKRIISLAPRSSRCDDGDGGTRDALDK
jgi:hypothetical protein